MRTIKITEAVWQAIAARGNFGETEDDVLRRVFKLNKSAPEDLIKSKGRRGRGNKRIAEKRMSAPISDGRLVVEFDDGSRRQWALPEKNDKDGIRKVRDSAVAWALKQGASDPGQTNAVRKALTDAGYFVSR